MFKYIAKQRFFMRSWLLVAIVLLAANIVSSQGMLVLTTDDPSDSSLAKVLSGATGATLVGIEKGVYNELLIQRIVALNPERIIIIGNTTGVTPQMETALTNHGFSVRRIMGRNDTEKSINLFREFRSVFGPKAVICVGRDAVMQAASYATSKKYPLFITDSKNLKTFLVTLKELGIKEYVLFSSNKQGDFKDEAKQKMESANALMTLTEKKIDYLNQRGVNVKQFTEHFATCRATFNVALKACEGGDFLRALRFMDETLICLEDLDNDLNEKIKSMGGI